jgi:ZIP family zinc transporter
VLAITLHNIPEGLAVGVAFGAVAYGLPEATITGAIALAFGIGIQNFPEGMAVSMPLRREGLSRFKSFLLGQASGIVEPVAGVLGAAAVLIARPILPYALSFAAGAMIFVVVEQLVPESQREGNRDISTMGAMIGFAVMMLLDVALGRSPRLPREKSWWSIAPPIEHPSDVLTHQHDREHPCNSCRQDS